MRSAVAIGVPARAAWLSCRSDGLKGLTLREPVRAPTASAYKNVGCREFEDIFE